MATAWGSSWGTAWGSSWGPTTTVTVPDVVGDTEAVAVADITGAGLIPVKSEQYSSTVAAGLVISQSPAAGASVGSGTSVSFILSLGERSSTGAGSNKRHKRRYYVEIDGQQFEVDSAQHAQALLERAAETAKQVAAEVAAEVVPRKRKSAASTKPVALPTPRISSPDPELADMVRQARIAINETYRKAAIDAELALLMALQRQRDNDDDDDETLLLLM